MECTNHPETEAVDRCVGCAEGFCENCLVKLHDETYCGQCKYVVITDPLAFADRIACHEETDFAVKYSLPDIPEVCEEANEALKYSLIGIFCFGILLEPFAISKALRAREKIRGNPQLPGEGKATAALIIGFTVIVLWLLGLVDRAGNL